MSPVLLWFGWGAFFSVLGACLLLGAAPVFAVRVIALLYPKGHPRRLELPVDMSRVASSYGILEQWRWLGEVMGLALIEGTSTRITQYRARRQPATVGTVLISILVVWRRRVSPMYEPVCRFHPTCSAYALEALEEYGALRGFSMAVRRLGRCAPWSPGGLDEVPTREVTPLR